MRTLNNFAMSLLMLLVTASFAPSTQAADLSGAWASDASVCKKVFVKSDHKISFTSDSELYGGGLIVEGNRATGSFQKCKIKSMKNEGAAIQVIAACSTGVMVSDLEIVVQMIGDDKMTLSPAGPVNVETAYVRCPQDAF